MSRIYTRSGDRGTTSLIGGTRVSKCDARVEAYGTVDELGAHVALLTDFVAENELQEIVTMLDRIAVELMTVEAQLALSEEFNGTIGTITSEQVEWLEQQIDDMSADLPPFKGFTIPGGHRVISQCHVCRTVCRRAERRILTAAEQYDVDEIVIRYVNRLSDLFYALSRHCGKMLGVEEKIWGK